jgi:hypothetical protein
VVGLDDVHSGVTVNPQQTFLFSLYEYDIANSFFIVSFILLSMPFLIVLLNYLSLFSSQRLRSHIFLVSLKTLALFNV